jgi:8-oxo-dGTP pyrophosphatase MutT (NUDIX family)
MTHPIAVGVLVGPRGVLMCRRVQSAKWYPGRWDFPGGHIEDGESAGEALARALLEEVAVTVVPPGNAPSFMVQANEGTPDGLALPGWVLYAWTGDPANVATDEHSEIRWLSPDDAVGLDLAHDSCTGLLQNLRWSRTDGAPRTGQ